MRRTRLIAERKSSRKSTAEQLGISEVYLRKIETGLSKPGRDTMIKFEKYYGVSMRDLFPDIFLSINDTECIKTNITC